MAKHKKSTFFKDFKAFISKGNVVDMAVGVVIGGAFGKIVTGLVNYIINPFVGLFVKSGSLDSLKTVIHEATYKADGVTVDQAEVAILWGTWLQTIIDFLITALCIFVVLRIIVKAKNLAEYKNRLRDGSITFDEFQADADHVSDRINRCMYAEMFAFYGIRELCKIFCMTDIQAYTNLVRHVRFVRHSDLSDGDCCRDDIYRLKK